ncbi:odorant receptor 22c-like [Sitodiplosis mosellana]|uniref:odorant receptor 22c-like n=1 Tax=Sitodiplosis mosellana TaxID=263140 RepID=UPI002445229C|nr:odorant receptor 22c-like [Sitodiplosis mosellana]
MYDEINRQIEEVSKKLDILLMRIVVPMFTLLPILLSLAKYISSGYSSESFQQIYPAKYPFNWKTPFGYMVCAFIQTITVHAAGQIFVSVLILVVGFCIFVRAFISDIQDNLLQLNEDFETEIDRLNLCTKERVELKEKLIGIIEFHSESIWFTNHFSDTNSSLILVFFLFTTISICNLFLQINMLFEDGNFVSIWHVGFVASPIIFWLYLFCHFGDQLTESFGNVDNAFYQLSWYELPLDMQKCIPMAISLAQKEIYLQGFGSINCTKDTFKKIMKSTFSYTSVLRQFSE